MNMFTLVAVLGVWLPFGAATVQGLFVAVVLMGIGTGSFVPLGGKSWFGYMSARCDGLLFWDVEWCGGTTLHGVDMYIYFVDMISVWSGLGRKMNTRKQMGRRKQKAIRTNMVSLSKNSFMRNRALRTQRHGDLAWIRLYDCQFCVRTLAPFRHVLSVCLSYTLLTRNSTLIGNPATGAILAKYGSTGLLVFLALVLLTGLVSAVGLRWCCLRGRGRGVVQES